MCIKSCEQLFHSYMYECGSLPGGGGASESVCMREGKTRQEMKEGEWCEVVQHTGINQVSSIHPCPFSDASLMPRPSLLLRPMMWPVLFMTSPATSQSCPMRGRQRTGRSCCVISAYWKLSSASLKCSTQSHLMLSE